MEARHLTIIQSKTQCLTRDLRDGFFEEYCLQTASCVLRLPFAGMASRTMSFLQSEFHVHGHKFEG